MVTRETYTTDSSLKETYTTKKTNSIVKKEENKLQRCHKKITKGPDIVVGAFWNAFHTFSALNCRYYFTIYTPYDSLAGHNTLNWRYRGWEKKRREHVWLFMCMKGITIRKKPIFGIESFKRSVWPFEPISIRKHVRGSLVSLLLI